MAYNVVTAVALLKLIERSPRKVSRPAVAAKRSLHPVCCRFRLPFKKVSHHFPFP